MNTTIKISTSTFILSSLLLITACSSSDGGSITSGTAKVPANAIVLNESNAEPTVAASVTTTDTVSLVAGIDTAPTVGLLDALELVQPRIAKFNDSIKNSGADLVYGVAFSESGACIANGSFSVSGDATDTSSRGTATFLNCDDGDGIIINGNFTWSFTSNDTTGAYSDSYTGKFGVTFTASGDFFNFTGVDFAQTGNDIESTYTITKANFAVDFTGGKGFLVTLGAPIVETVNFAHCPESGRIIISGANGTTAEGIYNGDYLTNPPGTMTIKANGVVINPLASCVF